MKISDISQAALDFANDQSGLGYTRESGSTLKSRPQSTNPATALAQQAAVVAQRQKASVVSTAQKAAATRLIADPSSALPKVADDDFYGMLKAVQDKSAYTSATYGRIEFSDLQKMNYALGAEADRRRRAGAAQPAAGPSKPDFASMDTAIITELYTAAQKGEGHTSFMGTLSAEQVKALKSDIEAEYNKRKGAIQKAEQSITAGGGDTQPEQQKDMTSGAGQSYADKIRGWMKQPWYWPVVIGGGAVLLIGVFALMRSRRTTQSVAPVQTMGLEELEGMDKPRRKRRRRKSKK